MGRMYAVVFENQQITAANGDYDFFEIDPAADSPVRIHACYLSQVTDVGDANEEMLRIAIVRGNTTSGNGSAAAETPLDSTDSAASFTAETVASTPASLGTPVNLHAETFNIRMGWSYIPTPECRPRADSGDGLLCVRLLAAVGSDIFMSGTLLVEEI